MSATTGHFVWYELMTPDPGAAEAFYRTLFGWSAADAGMEGFRYTLISAGDRQIGGMLATLPHLQGVPPHWTGYICVDDVDAYADRVAGKGGAVHRAPEDIPNVGRFAVVADPDGAVFVLFAPSRPAQPPEAAPCMTPGAFVWHELSAGPPDRALGFYAELFGWTATEAMDMGPLGTYQIFAIGGVPSGGMLRKPDAVPVPNWLFYVSVASIEPAMDRARQAGGTVLHGPTEVPGGNWIAIMQDPQGAVIGMVGPKA